MKKYILIARQGAKDEYNSFLDMIIDVNQN